MPHDNDNGSTAGMQRLKSDGSASVAELREFLGHMRGKNPQEVMGLVANSGLLKNTFISAVGLLAILLTASTLAYVFTPVKDANATEPNVAANSTTNDSAAGEQPAETPVGATATGAEQGAATTASGDKTLDTLGIGETKIANPDDNPLDNKLENLLDGVK